MNATLKSPIPPRLEKLGRSSSRLHAIQKSSAATPAPAPTGTPAEVIAPAKLDSAKRTIHRSIRPDGICVLTFDRPDSSANVFDLATLDELRQELDFISGALDVKGLIFTSAKRSIFIAGLDLHSLGENMLFGDVRRILELGQAQLNRVAELHIPTIAAIHGAAVGGGCELALACDYRIASPDRATKIGLPEVNLGLLPAWGGATRLPRLIGLPKALDIVLGGKTLAAKPARKVGLIDDIAPAEHLVELAARKIEEGKPNRPGHWLVNNAAAAAVIAARVRPHVLKRTRRHYPAVTKALDVMTKGVSESIPDSLKRERDAILELVPTEACGNLLRLFFLQDRAKKIAVPGTAGAPKRKVAHAAVIGAGVMGAGIAQWLTARGLSVVLRDINTEQVAKGMASIKQLYRDGVKRHIFTELEARAALDRLFPAPVEVPLHRTDLVIEAAVENLELKKKIFARLDELTGADTILATNTSALPVSELAASTRHPERVVGLHFFNPVHRMQLVEVIAARQTSPEVLQRAVRFTQQIGKLPVVVKDSPGFLVNRILMPYLIEAGNLFETGARVTDLDEAMLDFGMPMGPMRLLDEVGVDVALHVAETLAAHFSDHLKLPALLRGMTEKGLLGRKSGSGFYLHAKGKEPEPNPGMAAFVNHHTARKSSRDALQERMVLLMINEAARCLEEQIVTDPSDVDFAMVMGTGFAPFHGGPLRYADKLGAANVAGAMQLLVTHGAEQFKPCRLLTELAATGKSFHPTS